jgi:hypothetical protein
MKVITFLIFLISASVLYSQVNNSSGFIGSTVVKENVNGNIQLQTITTPQVYNENFISKQQGTPTVDQTNNNSVIRWKFTDPVAIGNFNMVSGNGLFSTVGWGLNTQRISLYGNSNSTPVWEHYTGAASNNYVAISDDAGIIAASSLANVYMFNHSSSTPFFNFSTGSLGNYNAGPIDITNDGGFIIVGINSGTATTDSSIVAGFSKDSASPTWTFKVFQTSAGGSSIQGVNIAGDDSLAIVNTYGGFYVVRTYTGQIIYQGMINPSSSSGTQTRQGISGNGNIIATINYSGYVRVYQRSGNTYNFMWQHQEPPGTYYNWMSAVDVSYDGSMISVGTLNFLTSSTYDGKVKLFNSGSSTPLWTATGLGDEVSAVSFSKNGHILSACSWGDYYNPLKENLYIFKTSHPNNVPIYSFSDSSGSFFWCSTSNDGQTVIGSGKKVHARQFGNGGIVYNVYVDTSEPTGVLNNQTIADRFELSQNYPNPFNPSTVINYTVAKEGFVKIAVFDILGREVALPVNKYRRSGRYSVVFNAENLSSGMYFYRIEANGFTATKKMMLIK